ncbi:MAG: hypothetical protein OXI77_03765 [Chloroflexota bacterium]|nr:hypothetical protein [Chloroflexota bacterium]
MIDSKAQASAFRGVYGFYPLTRASQLLPDLRTAWRHYAVTPFRHELDHVVYVSFSLGLSGVLNVLIYPSFPPT